MLLLLSSIQVEEHAVLWVVVLSIGGVERNTLRNASSLDGTLQLSRHPRDSIHYLL